MSVSEAAVSEFAVSETDLTYTPRRTGALRPRGNPCWTRDAHIGDVGGALDKRDSLTEGEEPYAAMVRRELRAMRGSAYTQKSGTLVNAENIALSRVLSATFFRVPEKMRASATPRRSDEALGYWVEVFGIAVRPQDRKSDVRERCMAAAKIVTGNNATALRQSLSDLLGDAFVELTRTAPNQLEVEVTHPPGMDREVFENLVYVQAHSLLDKAAASWAGFTFVET